MKLSEALIRRADAQKRIAQLRQRLSRVALVQEGERPAEEPVQLLEELQHTLVELTDLVKRINHTNIVTRFDEGRMLTDVLAERDALMLERGVLDGLIHAASYSQNRYSRTELKVVSTVDIAELQQTVNDLSRQHRELDMQIQELNWQTELVE